MMNSISNRQTLYFAVYINIGGQSSQKAQETISEFMRVYMSENPLKPKQYEERFFVFPVRDQPTKMELLFPSPFLKAEQMEELYEKYYGKFEELTDKINRL